MNIFQLFEAGSTDITKADATRLVDLAIAYSMQLPKLRLLGEIYINEIGQPEVISNGFDIQANNFFKDDVMNNLMSSDRPKQIEFISPEAASISGIEGISAVLNSSSRIRSKFFGHYDQYKEMLLIALKEKAERSALVKKFADQFFDLERDIRAVLGENHFFTEKDFLNVDRSYDQLKKLLEMKDVEVISFFTQPEDTDTSAYQAQKEEWLTTFLAAQASFDRIDSNTIANFFVNRDALHETQTSWTEKPEHKGMVVNLHQALKQVCSFLLNLNEFLDTQIALCDKYLDLFSKEQNTDLYKLFCANAIFQNSKVTKYFTDATKVFNEHWSEKLLPLFLNREKISSTYKGSAVCDQLAKLVAENFKQPLTAKDFQAAFELNSIKSLQEWFARGTAYVEEQYSDSDVEPISELDCWKEFIKENPVKDIADSFALNLPKAQWD